MQALQRILSFWVATSIFTACCALSLCMATELLVAGTLPPLITPLHLTIAGSTLIVYNLPRLIPRPYGRPRGYQQLRGWYYGMFAVGVLLVGASAWRLPAGVMELCLITGILSFAYFLPALPGNKRRLRDYGLVKIFVLTSVWTVATTAMPVVNLGLSPLSHPFELLIRFVFIFSLCVLFDIRDMDTDTGNNITTLPHRTGEAWAYRIVNISLLLFLALGVMQYFRHPQLPGRLVAAVLAMVVTGYVARFARMHPGHWSFVLITDGMMLFYAGALILLHL